MRKFLSCPALLLLLLLATDARMVFAGQAVAEVVGRTEIPRTGFKTWSLFLICAQDWVAPEKSADLANLYHRFKGFGDAIGKDNVAVWFWKQRLPITDARLADNVDVPRSVEYCSALRLVPSEGPFLVVTAAYPELPSFPQERAVYALGALPAPAVATLLNKLTDQLLLQGRVDAAAPATPSSTVASPPPASPASPGQPPAASFWIQFLVGAQRTMIGVGCNVKLQINTGVLSAELRGCPAR